MKNQRIEAGDSYTMFSQFTKKNHRKFTSVFPLFPTETSSAQPNKKS